MPVADFVRVKNVWDRPVSGAYGSVGYLIRPGEEQMLDRECAVKDFGDWTKRDLSTVDDKLKFRTIELARIRGLYGVYVGAKIAKLGPDGHALRDEHGVPQEESADQVWSSRIPKVEIYEMDGTKVTTILEDPAGTTLPLETAPADEQAQALSSQNDRIAKLEQMLEQALTERATVQVPEDKPETERPKASKPKATAARSSD